MYVKEVTSFCQVLKKVETKENWSFFLPHGVYKSTHTQSQSPTHLSEHDLEVQCNGEQSSDDHPAPLDWQENDPPLPQQSRYSETRRTHALCYKNTARN